MNFSSKLLENAVDEMSQLPGIGKRTALRLVLFLLNQPNSQTVKLSKSLVDLVEGVILCKNCHNISDLEVCEICTNNKRDKSVVCVVEDIRDVMAIESTGQFNGVYHVLGGKISPIEGIGPNQLNINSLIEKIRSKNVSELIFALSATMEGDTTNFYIFRQIKDVDIKITTIARGVSVGNELEYTDEVTLARSIQNRRPYETDLSNK